MSAWKAVFEEARNTSTWKEMFPARRENILKARQAQVYGEVWTVRDLYVDLKEDVAKAFSPTTTRPKRIYVFADVLYLSADLDLSLENIALMIVARRIEVADKARIRVDYSNNRFGAMIFLYAAEIDGKFAIDSLTSESGVSKSELIPLALPKNGGLVIRYDAQSKKAKATERPRVLENKLYETGSPLWLMAASAIQMAVALVTPQPNNVLKPQEAQELRDKAKQILDFVRRYASDALTGEDTTPAWVELAKEAEELKRTIDVSAERLTGIGYASLFVRLLNLEAPAKERQRRLDQARRSNRLQSLAASGDLLDAKVPAPDPLDIKYVRHGAQTTEAKEWNGWERPVRHVTLSGFEIELDDLDHSGFLKEYNGKEDIEELSIHADTLVIGTRVHLPQANILIYCRELYFEGPNACIDTQPITSKYRADLDKDGNDGTEAGNIFVYIKRFGTTEKGAAKHFRAIGGIGQDPDEGEIGLSQTLRHLPRLFIKKEGEETKEDQSDWDTLFSYTNRKVGNTVVEAPSWSQYKEYRSTKLVDGKIVGTVYAEIAINGAVPVASMGTKASPGTGGKGSTPGRPGSGGTGGNVSCTLPKESIAPYVDVSGGAGGSPKTSTEGGAGGTPDIAYWLLFKNKVVNGKTVFEATIEKHEGQKGPSGDAGPAAFKPIGDEGQVQEIADAQRSAWLSSINFKTAVQFAKDALAGGNTGVARECLMPYLDALAKRPAEEIDDTILQLETEASALAEQAIENVDYFGNPPGWVPLMALESAVGIYENILNSAMREIYTAYYIQKAWQVKEGRQEAARSLINLLNKSTVETQKSLIRTRKKIITTMQELKQLNEEIDEYEDGPIKRLAVIEKRLRSEADYLTDKSEKLQIIAASFKIFGAVAKAIPLPEPYQMAAGAIGGMFDIAGEFVAEEGFTDKAFSKLKSGVNEFLSTNTDNLVNQSNKKLDSSLEYATRDIKQLQDKAGIASKDKELLQESYDEKKKEHDELVKQEKKKLDAIRKRMLYGRGSRTKEMITYVEKDFEKFESEQNNTLARNTRDYQEQSKKLKRIQGEIETKEKAFKTSKEAVDKAKIANGKKVKEGIDQVKKIAAGAESIAKTVNELMASRSQLNSQWDKTLAKLMTNDKELAEVKRSLAGLNQRKTALATQLIALKTSLAKQSNLISNNLLSVNALGSQVGSSSDALDPMALSYVQSVGQEAHQSLMQFLYYVVKAYEYYMVQPWGRLDYGSQKLFESLQNVLEPSDSITGIEDLNQDQKEKLRALISKPVSFKNEVLSKEDFDLLKIVYEKPLKDMGKRLADQLLSGSGRLLKEAPKIITLGSEELQELNSRFNSDDLANVMPLSLAQLRQIDQSSERQRIGNIKVVRVKCRTLRDKFPDSVTFKISHRGKSIVRADGRLFAFEPEGGQEEQRSQRSRVTFTTIGGKTAKGDWAIDKDIGSLEGKTLWQASVDNQASLLNQFLKNDGSAQPITLSQFRPGVFSDFEMEVETSAGSKIELQEVQLQITTEAGDAPKGQTILIVSTNPELAIPITSSSKDIGGRSGGLGNYTGIFKDLRSPVRISVPERFGNYVHTGWSVDGENKPANGQHEYAIGKSSYLVANFEPTDRLFRRTKGIVSDAGSSDPKKEADVILTAAALGFAASLIQKDTPVQFDMDPLEGGGHGKVKVFEGTVEKIDASVADYLKKHQLEPGKKVHAGLSPGYTKGAVIVGVYQLAGQSVPLSISAPVLTPKGQALYDKIKNVDSSIPQYTGRGAYTGFVDNHNTEGNTDPVGPRSTARFLASTSPVDEPEPAVHPRWLPTKGSAVWETRKRKGRAASYVPWGLIMGDFAGKDPAQPNTTESGNLADQATIEMRDRYGMVFNGEPDVNDIANYTHGMIQAIYKSYSLGPSCTPYEIAVGDQTKKMASCLPCTLFMAANGYPPTSTHLGRGESWAPLRQPYNPGGDAEPNEVGVIRDLNARWYEGCAEFVTLGLKILDDDHVADTHKASRNAVRDYLDRNKGKTVAGTLILDALTLHDSEAERIDRTLKAKSA